MIENQPDKMENEMETGLDRVYRVDTGILQDPKYLIQWELGCYGIKVMQDF